MPFSMVTASPLLAPGPSRPRSNPQPRGQRSASSGSSSRRARGRFGRIEIRGKGRGGGGGRDKEVTTEGTDRDAAARGEQRLLVVVGEPHPQHAVQMARQQSSR